MKITHFFEIDSPLGFLSTIQIIVARPGFNGPKAIIHFLLYSNGTNAIAHATPLLATISNYHRGYKVLKGLGIFSIYFIQSDRPKV